MKKTKAQLLAEMQDFRSLAKAFGLPVTDEDGNNIPIGLILLEFAHATSRLTGALFVKAGVTDEETITRMYDEDFRSYVHMMAAVAMSGHNTESIVSTSRDATDDYADESKKLERDRVLAQSDREGKVIPFPT